MTNRRVVLVVPLLVFLSLSMVLLPPAYDEVPLAGELAESPKPAFYVVATDLSVAKTFGLGRWMNNLIGALSTLEVPIRLVKKSVLEQAPDDQLFPSDSDTLVVFLQDYSAHWLPIISRIRKSYTKMIFIAPFALGQIGTWLRDATISLPPPGSELLNNCAIITESFAMRDVCSINLQTLYLQDHVKCVVSPFGVNTSEFAPNVKRAEREGPVIYIKNHSGSRFNETRIFNMLARQGIYSYTVLRKGHDPLATYAPAQYKHALSFAPWMVAFTPSETFGFFIQEARSMDVPLFIVGMGTWKPVWFSEADGITVHESFSDDELDIKFADFLNTLPTFTPRKNVERTLSLEVCSARLLRRIQQSNLDLKPFNMTLPPLLDTMFQEEENGPSP